jgi:hypothetical protein
MESFLREHDLSTQEGALLMCVAEALATADARRYLGGYAEAIAAVAAARAGALRRR